MTGILKIGLTGFLATLALNLMAFLVLSQIAAQFFAGRWWSTWFPAYVPWFVLVVVGFAGQRR